MKKRTLHIYLAFSLATLFLGYYGSTTLFIHTHVINHKKYTHSHPHSSTDSHSHTSSTLELLDLFANTYPLLQVPFIYTPPLVIEKVTSYYLNIAHLLPTQPHELVSWRAPPILI